MRIEQYREKTEPIIRKLLAPHTSCALIGYPDHWNAGDAAIWLGTRELLHKSRIHIDYACDAWSYNPIALQSAVPTGPILLIGGGNFGDVYQNEVALRNRVLQDFPHRKIVQLSQSIWFRNPKNLKTTNRLLAGMHDFTLLVRDLRSLAFSRNHLAVDATLCPDLAIFFQTTPPPKKPDLPIVALWRDDVEAPPGNKLKLPNGIVQDWIDPSLDKNMLSVTSRLFLACNTSPPNGGPYVPSARRTLSWKLANGMLWEKLARDRVQRGCHMLQRGQVVITNRLHAHLLCAMMHIPHVVCDTANQKISAYRETWPLEYSWIASANAPDEAIEKAKDLVKYNSNNGT